MCELFHFSRDLNKSEATSVQVNVAQSKPSVSQLAWKRMCLVLRDFAFKTFPTNLKKKIPKRSVVKMGHICVSLDIFNGDDKKEGERKPDGFRNSSPSLESLYCPGKSSSPTRFRAILKMAPGSGRRPAALLLHHLVITWRGPNDGAIDLPCQTQQIAVPSLVWLSARRRQ